MTASGRPHRPGWSVRRVDAHIARHLPGEVHTVFVHPHLDLAAPRRELDRVQLCPVEAPRPVRPRARWIEPVTGSSGIP